MIRETLIKHGIGLNKEFRYRGIEPGRIENFSDACLALAITLLLISTSPPADIAQIKRFAWDIIPFCFCITLIILIWYQHFIFFYRYGLRGPAVIVLNTIFIIIILFYVYPLRFLTQGILIPLSYLFDNEALMEELMLKFKNAQIADLMIIYGLGAASVFITLSLLYRHALNNAEELELNLIEKFDTKVSVITNLLLGLVPFLSLLMAVIFNHNIYAGMISGFTYCLYPAIMVPYGKYVDKKRTLILNKMNQAPSGETLDEQS